MSVCFVFARCCSAVLSAVVCIVLNNVVGISCLSLSSRHFFVVAVVESSVTVVYPCSDHSSTGGLDDLTGLLCVQRELKF